jgi:hypothetical protein
LAFVGDSLTGQQVGGWACTLWAAGFKGNRSDASGGRGVLYEIPEINHTFTYGFPTHLLLSAATTCSNAFHGQKLDSLLNLRKLHPMLESALLADPKYIIISTGTWCTAHSKQESAAVRSMFAMAAYATVHLIGNYMKKHRLHSHLIFRFVAMRHFEGGEWWQEEGKCMRETPAHALPADTFVSPHEPSFMNSVWYEALARVADGFEWSILRADLPSLSRADAHLSERDCTHWCLPGVPDVWNELLLSHICG